MTSVRISLRKQREITKALLRRRQGLLIPEPLVNLCQALTDRSVELKVNGDEAYLKFNQELLERVEEGGVFENGPGYHQRFETQVKNFLKGQTDLVQKAESYQENGLVGRFRPDILCQVNRNLCLVIEVDEDQHKGYDQLNEYIRMSSIGQAVKGQCLFLRFNPTGGPVLSFRQRLEVLKDVVEDLLRGRQRVSAGWCTAFPMYMFYDGHNPRRPWS